MSFGPIGRFTLKWWGTSGVDSLQNLYLAPKKI